MPKSSEWLKAVTRLDREFNYDSLYEGFAQPKDPEDDKMLRRMVVSCVAIGSAIFTSLLDAETKADLIETIRAAAIRLHPNAPPEAPEVEE